MLDPKKPLNPGEFLCKCCWKVSSGIKYNIDKMYYYHGKWEYILDPGQSQVDMYEDKILNRKFHMEICENCFNGMTSYLDTIANEIVDNVTEDTKKCILLSKENLEAVSLLKKLIQNRVVALSGIEEKLATLEREAFRGPVSEDEEEDYKAKEETNCQEKDDNSIEETGPDSSEASPFFGEEDS